MTIEFTKEQTEALWLAFNIIRKRSIDPQRDYISRLPYISCRDMLSYALDENFECLAQFDDVQLDCANCHRSMSLTTDDVAFCNICEDYEYYVHMGRDWK